MIAPPRLVTRWLERSLHPDERDEPSAIRPLDPVTFLVVPALIVSVAAAALWQPARRALGVDPAQALRNE